MPGKINPKKQTKSFIPFKRTLIILLTPTLLIYAVYLIFSFLPAPTYPLGDKIEYIGKSDYGCWYGCDSRPGSSYYYATALSYDELVRSFPKSDSIDTSNKPNAFSISKANNHFYIDINNDPATIPNDIKAKTDDLIFSIDASNYELAKSLR